MIKVNGHKIFFKQYKYELIAFIVNATVAFFSFRFKENNAVIFAGVISVLLISLFIIIYFKTKDKDFYYLSLNKPGAEKDWVGRGRFNYIRNEKCFEITDSSVGFLFPKTALWDDYRFEFDFKIINKTIAWIVRADNLSNYVMFQCSLDGINPHIRVGGDWVVFKHSDINFTFNDKLSYDTWYRGIIICEKRSVRNMIYQYKDNKIVFDRHWEIPEGITVSKEEGNEGRVKFFQNIDFDFGAVGFRNWGSERGFVKKVYLEKL